MTIHQPSTSTSIVPDLGLGIVFAAGLIFTAYLLIDSWGGNSWQFTCAVGAVASLVALVRRANPVWTAAAGLAVAAVAVLVSWIFDLPQEPGPVTALALAVLVGSAVRKLPSYWAVTIAAGGIAVVAATWLATWLSGGVTTVALLNTAGWLAAVVVGLRLRLLDAHPPTTVGHARRS